MEFQKTLNFLDKNFDNEDFPKYVTKKWIEVYDNHKETMMLIKKLESNHQF